MTVSLSWGTLSYYMPLQKQICGQDCEMQLSGRVDGTAAHALELEVLTLAKTSIQNVYLNLSGADFLCSAALRVVLQANRQWKTRGRSFVISRTSPEVDQILDLTGMRELIVESK